MLTVQRWRSLGYEFAIDDFGAGFISFPFLSLLMPQYVKVDRTMVCQALSSGTFKEFLHLLLHAVRTYATAGVIAEGIETEQELQIVRDLGIDHGQGYLFGKPSELTAAAVPMVSRSCRHVLLESAVGVGVPS
jgi:EAL domain-containing protein (putative c-di-GMP-specific phosphodiesterase class I)